MLFARLSYALCLAMPMLCAAAPATRPATADTPKNAVRGYLEAMIAGDAKAALALIEPENTNVIRLMELNVRIAVAEEELRRSIVRAYDEQAAAGLLNAGRLAPSQSWLHKNLSWLDECEVTITGDHAVLRLAGQPAGQWDLVRKDGKWAIVIKDDPDPAGLQILPIILRRTEDLVKTIRTGVDAANAKELLAGRFRGSGIGRAKPEDSSTKEDKP